MIKTTEELARDAWTRYHQDPVFHALVNTTSQLLAGGQQEMGRLTRGVISLALHARDVVADHVKNPSYPSPESLEMLCMPIDPETVQRFARELGLEEQYGPH